MLNLSSPVTLLAAGGGVKMAYVVLKWNVITGSLTYSWNWLTDYFSIDISEKRLTSGLENQTAADHKDLDFFFKKLSCNFLQSVSWPILSSKWRFLSSPENFLVRPIKRNTEKERERESWPGELLCVNCHEYNLFNSVTSTSVLNTFAPFSAQKILYRS